jgi:hypothetical protein
LLLLVTGCTVDTTLTAVAPPSDLATATERATVSGPTATPTVAAVNPAEGIMPRSRGCLPPEIPETYPLANVTMTLERSACYGTCPDYTVTIHGDGRVVYEGRNFVTTMGIQEGQIDREDVVDLLKAFYDADYFCLADACRDHADIKVQEDGTVTQFMMAVTEQPTQTVTPRIGLYQKRVVDYWKAPTELQELEQRIDDTAGVAKWVGHGPGGTGDKATPEAEGTPSPANP